MKTRRDGIATMIVLKEHFKEDFKTIWHQGRQAWERKINGAVFTAKPHEEGSYMLTPFPPVYKIFINIDPHEQTGSIFYSNVSVKTQELINAFVYALFKNYPFREPQEYQIHVRLDADWELRKISVINSLKESDDHEIRYLLEEYVKALLEGTTSHPFLIPYLLPRGEDHGTMG